MENITGEINIIEAEIKKTEKAISKEYESYKELDREVKNHFEEYNAIPPGAGKEIKTYLTNAMREGLKDLQTHRHTIKGLQSRLNTLKQSKTAKVDKIMHKDTPEKQEQANYNWIVKDDKVCFDGKEVFLAELPIRLFLSLYNKRGRFVKRETLEKCWNKKPGRYESFVTDAMKKLGYTLKNNLDIQKDIFEVKKSGKKITAYKLP